VTDAPVLVDFESRSKADLRRVGGRLYWQDPTSEAICAVLYRTDTGEVEAWRPGDPPPARLELAVAHNATTFDRFAAERCGWRVGAWLDSSQMARRAGLPGALDALASQWLGRRKDIEGSKFTKALSSVSRAKAKKGQFRVDVTPEVYARVLGYCANDVEVLADAWPRLEPWADVDADVAAADRAVNDRGICVDVELVHALQRQLERQQEEAVAEAAEALGLTEYEVRAQAGSSPQFCAATGLPNMQAETLIDRASYGNLIDHPLVGARQAISGVVLGKLRAALNMTSPDGRMRDWAHYYGGHTGRWSSKGMQLHNLPRIGFEDDAKKIGWHAWEYVQALVDGAMTDAPLSKSQVGGLLRACFVASPGKTLAVLDYSGIEARVNAWAAGDTQAIEVFKAFDAGTGPDPYCVMATGIFSRTITKGDKTERNVGKQAELGCGYGMGGPKFGGTCENAGVVLAEVGVDAQEVVNAWRKLHRPIVQLWKACEKAFAAACEGREAWAGPWMYAPIGEDSVACVLPSGRPIVYPSAQAKPSRTPWGAKSFSLSYQGRKGREHLYGGKLVENAVQATARELLADALVRCEADGLDPVLHVHDENVCEVDASAGADALGHMRYVMAETAPEWAKGLPIRLDGFAEGRYRK
jgi:DNA polymerase bacteriophage-type